MENGEWRMGFWFRAVGVRIGAVHLSSGLLTAPARHLSIAAPCVPVIAALMCTTKRRVEGVRILDFMELQKVK
jgi:hypothetical protein